MLSTATLEFEASAPECTLNASTSYFAVVQVQNLNNPYDPYGKVSFPSNFQETGISLTI